MIKRRENARKWTSTEKYALLSIFISEPVQHLNIILRLPHLSINIKSHTIPGAAAELVVDEHHSHAHIHSHSTRTVAPKRMKNTKHVIFINTQQKQNDRLANERAEQSSGPGRDLYYTAENTISCSIATIFRIVTRFFPYSVIALIQGRYAPDWTD